MNLVKKIKDILFEVEDDDVEVVKINDEVKEEKTDKVLEIPQEEVTKEPLEKPSVPNSERELFKSENNTFTFPDFDEEEFQSNFSRVRETRENKDLNYKTSNNVLDFERKKNSEKRSNEYLNKYDRSEHVEPEKKKFKPSPIISPVYGILNKDYKSSDIVNKNEVPNIDVDYVRKKAFDTIIEEKTIEKPKVEEAINEPVVTFFEDKDNKKTEDFKSIDALLEEASDEISLDETLEIPVTNNLEAIEEELEKIDEEEKNKRVDKISSNETFTDAIDDALNESLDNKDEKDVDSDLFELIDSMYDEREEE